MLVQELGFAARVWAGDFFFLGWVYNGIARPIVRGWTQKNSRAFICSRERNRALPLLSASPWPQARALGAFPGRRFRPRFSNLRAWEERGGRGGSTLVAPGMGDGGGYGGHGGHGHGDRELVESSAQEGVGRVAAWERWRKVWRCSPSRELDRDGLGE